MESLREILKGMGVVEAKLAAAEELAASEGLTFHEAVIESEACSQAVLAQAMAKEFKVPFANLERALQGKGIPEAIHSQVPADVAQNHRVVPVAVKDGKLVLAMESYDPHKLQAVAAVLGREEFSLDYAIATPAGIGKALGTYYGDSALTKAVEEAGGEPDVELRDHSGPESDLGADDAPVIKLVHQMVDRAVREGASDIHLEPFEGHLDVRYRIDGVCQVQPRIPPHLRKPVVSRAKIMAEMDMAEKRDTQDGRIRRTVDGREIDFRVNVIPTVHEESVVMRILDRERGLVDLDELGFHSSTREEFEGLIARPHGIFLVTGPTGSGKTTTLYSALRRLNTPDRKIITAENPVEYELDGINQVQIRPEVNLTFERALRAMMRQAPNVILVGEIRDLETASIAMQAALTGHLVFSTLHTNDAPSALTRLIDMKVKPFLVSSAVMGVLAQRLVRVLCTECKEEIEPTDAELEEFKIDRSTLAGATVHRAVGCSACRDGYRGRQGIYELMPMDGQLARMTFKRSPTSELAAHAKAQGMTTLRQDAVRKVLQGTTTFEEVLRVTGTES